MSYNFQSIGLELAKILISPSLESRCMLNSFDRLVVRVGAHSFWCVHAHVRMFSRLSNLCRNALCRQGCSVHSWWSLLL